MFLTRLSVLHFVRFKWQLLGGCFFSNALLRGSLEPFSSARIHQHCRYLLEPIKPDHYQNPGSLVARVMGKGLSSTRLWKEGCQGSGQSRFALINGKNVTRNGNQGLLHNAAAPEQINLAPRAGVSKVSICKLNGATTHSTTTGSPQKVLGLDTTRSSMRGLAVLRAIGAAAAFENHLTGQVPRLASNALRHSSVVVAADTRSGGYTTETEPKPQSTTNARSRSNSQFPSPPALKLNNHRASGLASPGWEAERARSSAESSAPEKRPLPPLAIVEKLLKVKGGSASLPLLKDDWSEGGRRRDFKRYPEAFTSADRKSHNNGGDQGQSVQAQLGEKGIVLPEYKPGSYRILCPKV